MSGKLILGPRHKMPQTIAQTELVQAFKSAHKQLVQPTFGGVLHPSGIVLHQEALGLFTNTPPCDFHGRCFLTKEPLGSPVC